jgi:serine/threonine-protein kinase
VDSLPRVVDRYELLAVLGSGGFATVYRARHVHTHQVVAVKILENKRSGADRFIAEARAAAAVQHRNVVRVLDCGQSGEDVFIVMELASGPTLAEALHAGPFPPPRAVEIAIQILDGLEAAHARAIIHRDIKPPNILLTRDTDGSDLPKILDFGVSKQLTAISGTLDGTAIGTPGYMAPELFGGAKHADARADVYAVAVTLYEMLSGRLPFSAATYEELVVQVATQRPAPISIAAPHVSAPIAAAVDRGLARDREARWQTAEQFASALRGALLGIAPPSSHQFEATIDARQTSSPSAPSSGLAPDPSTLRTQPPPVVNTASRRETTSRGLLGWVVGLVGLILVASAGGAFAVWRVMSAREAKMTSAPIAIDSSAQSIDASPVALATTAPDELAPVATLAAANPVVATTAHAPHVPPSGARSGIRFDDPKVVGTASKSSVVALEALVVPRAQRCRPDGTTPTLAHVDIFIASEGTINLAHATPNDEGDTVTSACLAEVLKKAATPATFAPGGSGIATLHATFDPR